MAIEIALPPSREELAALRIGDEVLLSGPVFTARDATHVRLVEQLRATGELPYGLAGQVLFYAGPTPAAAGRVLGSVGPTTSKRMDAWTPELLAAGILATIGKGVRSEAVREACAEFGAVYFSAVGGAAAKLATHVEEAEVIAYPELGTEALMGLTLSRFPVFVSIDSLGGDLHEAAPREWRERMGL